MPFTMVQPSLRDGMVGWGYALFPPLKRWAIFGRPYGTWVVVGYGTLFPPLKWRAIFKRP
ncbi:hypothetical protein ACX8XN_11935 [Calditrichota bacterium GD2]